MSKHKEIFNGGKLPAGKWWVGELCYVMHSEWTEFCDKTWPADGSEVEGIITLDDGRTCGYMRTAYGDGCYDAIGHRGKFLGDLGVDAGLIGCIRVADIDQANPENNLGLGIIVNFPEPFELSKGGRDEGMLHFGNEVTVQTSYTEEEEQDDVDGDRW